MDCKTPREMLKEQLERLRLDDDLRLMVFTGLDNISDEEALRLTEELKLAISAIPNVLKKLIPEATRHKAHIVARPEKSEKTA